MNRHSAAGMVLVYVFDRERGGRGGAGGTATGDRGRRTGRAGGGVRARGGSVK